MSEQEKKSGAAGGSSIVLVEQSAASRHKQPFRPTELQEEAPDLLHKRSRAPAVPSVAEELKDNANSESNDRKECERAMSSEKQKHSMAKKLSATVKRRGSSPEAITLAQLEVTKTGSVTPPPQPIPAQVTSLSDESNVAENKLADRKEEDDSITDEVAELRTPEVAKKPSEWEDKPHDSKRKEVSWHDDEYLDKVKIFETCTKSRVCVLERKSSIGPCFRSTPPFGRPSGITICLPNKHAKPAAGEDCSRQQSVINITVSKKSVNRSVAENHRAAQDEQVRVNFLGTLKEKLSNMTEKIRNAL